MRLQKKIATAGHVAVPHDSALSYILYLHLGEEVLAKHYNSTHYNASKKTCLLPGPGCCCIWCYRFASVFLSCLFLVYKVHQWVLMLKGESRKEKQRSLVATLCRDDKHTIIFTLLSVIYKTFHRPPPLRDSP